MTHDDNAAPDGPLDGFAGHLIRRLQQRHAALWSEIVSSTLTGPQYGVLLVLDTMPGINQRRLGESLDLDAATIAGMVARLEARGLVSRLPDDVDGRRKVLRLTDAGAELRRELAPRVDALQSALTAALSADEAVRLREMLHRMLS